MTRLARLHVPGGLYYIVLKGNGDDAIFRDEQDYGEFSRLVAKSLRRNRCRIHAFCWLENRALMAIQIENVATGRFVQHVTGRYAKYLHDKLRRTGHLFAHHHRALLVQRPRYLLHLVRYIHRAPIRARLAASPGEYAWSGDRAYLDLERIPWLTTNATKEMLTRARRPGSMSYLDWVDQEDDPVVAQMFENGHRDEHRAAGDDVFIASISERVEQPREEGGLDEIVTSVVREQGVSMDSVFSPSRRRRLVLVRAVIAWRATRGGVATLAEVGAHLGRDPSTLWTAMDRYQRIRPELFPGSEWSDSGSTGHDD